MIQVQAILDERARRLAQAVDTASPVDLTLVLVCAAGTEWFGVEMSAVARVAPYQRPSFLPSRDRALLGLIARAGWFYRVYDAPLLLGLKPGVGEHVLFLRARQIALRFDAILGVTDVAPLGEDDASRMRASHPAIRAFGQAPDGPFAGRVISILDPQLLRSAPEGVAETGAPRVDR